MPNARRGVLPYGGGGPLRPDGDAPYLEGKLVAHHHTDPLGESNPVPFERSKSVGSLGAPLKPRAHKHRTRSRASVGLTVVNVLWGIALRAPVQGTTRHHGAAGRAKEAR